MTCSDFAEMETTSRHNSSVRTLQKPAATENARERVKSNRRLKNMQTRIEVMR